MQDVRDEWLKFFWEGDMTELKALTGHSPELMDAVEVLRPSHEREQDYWLYLARLDHMRVETIKEREHRESKEKLETVQQEVDKQNQIISVQQHLRCFNF